MIRPGDPILRVKTDESIVSVIALFPFGLVQPLRHLSSEDVWQTRFLAPTDRQDGTYTVRLILRDQVGHTYRESKTFKPVNAFTGGDPDSPVRVFGETPDNTDDLYLKWKRLRAGRAFCYQMLPN